MQKHVQTSSPGYTHKIVVQNSQLIKIVQQRVDQPPLKMGMDDYQNPTQSNGCDYLSMP